MLDFLFFSALLFLIPICVSALILFKKSSLIINDKIELDVYRDQLDQVSKDIKRGILNQSEAELSRIEIKKRLLESDSKTPKKLNYGKTNSNYLLMIALSLFLLICSVSLYLTLGFFGTADAPLNERLELIEKFNKNRPSQAVMESSIAPDKGNKSKINYDKDYLQLIQNLRETVKRNNSDITGHRLLVKYENHLNRFTEAHLIQEKLINLLGSRVTALDYTDYAQLLINAANGYVSPEAEESLKKALKLDKKYARALYLTGLLMIQSKRPDIAYKIWVELLRTGNKYDPWISEIKKSLGALELKAGLRND
ncbi:MAG: c-type cytochrome biogenesis protein CcmI [Paracoccaceae bacterium]|nr:c-type cytochrome biogenesis protein CcmI [Paracoccaceae bacterium]